MRTEAIDPDLPDAFHEEHAESVEQRDIRLSQIGVTIAGLRDAAVKARKESGIETVWMTCEESYLCIDDANRHEFAGARWAKPTSMEGPVTANSPPRGTELRSNIFVRLTARYVDMGAAKISEILLPIDDKAFSIGPTPLPDLVNALDDPTMVAVDGQPVMMAPPAPDASAAMPMGPDGAAPGPQAPQQPKPLTVGDLAKAKMDKAADAAEKAETRIYDWMVEANYAGEMRKVIADAARIGVGVLKAPFPDVRTRYAYSKTGEAAKLVVEQKTAPSARSIDPWNFFPHDGCGENPHHGDHVFERDFISSKQLKDLKRQVDLDGAPIYLSPQIDKVLAEGPEKCNTEDGRNPAHPKNKERYTVWYFTGMLKRSDMMISGAVGLEDLPEELNEVYAFITLVNDSVIRATLNPMDSGRFPYHAMPWSRRAGSWAGVGVAEQIFAPQRTANASMRALLNNAGFSSGAQIVIDQRAVVPADGQWQLSPNKIWYLTGEGLADDVRKMFMLLEFPNIGPQLEAILNLAHKQAEEATNIPLISQGQQGPNVPDTFGAAEMQNNNANTLLRSIAYSFDDHITVPVVDQFYEWLLLDPDVPEDEKGDFQINARGSIAMVEKAIQEQTWIRLLAVAVNPAYGLSPQKVAEEVVRSKRLDPRKVQYSDQEKKDMASRPPPEPVQVTVAKINEDSAIKVATIVHGGGDGQQGAQPGQPEPAVQVAQIRQKTEQQRTISDAAEKEKDRNHEIEMMRMKVEIAKMEFGQNLQVQLNEVKAKLADTTMKLQMQERLSTDAAAIDLHKHHNPAPGATGDVAPQVADPAVEPAGRAEPGQAFAQ